MTADEGAYLRGSRQRRAVPPAQLAVDPGPGAQSSGARDVGAGRDGVLVLIAELCGILDAEGVRYCHWKSNEAIARSESGENDLDLLVARADADRFEDVLRRLRFKVVLQPAWKRLPGIYHAYGLDPSGAFVHIHAHYQLVVGDDMTKNLHLPIESAYVASARREGLFPTPAPEYELALFLIRMTVKHCTWDGIVSLQGSLSTSERRELVDLRARADPDELRAVMERHLPFIESDLWRRCERAVGGDVSSWFRIRTAARLQGALSTCSRRAPQLDTWVRMWRRGRTVVRRKALRRGPVRNQLASGGALVAIVGGDGAGKTTAVEGLARWFDSEHIDCRRLHLGKPGWSPLTTVVKGGLRLAAAAKRGPTSSAKALRTELSTGGARRLGMRSRARLSWEVLTARDRYRAYRRARRLASNGSVVICDRYPLTEVVSMDGAVTARIAADPSGWGRWARTMAAMERRYYERIARPDVLIVLRVDPDTAVERKRGLEPESTVRPRSEEIWRIDWRDRSAVVIDASSSRDEVLSQVKSAVWSRL